MSSMSDSLRLTIVYEEGEDGWTIARIREIPAAMSQGSTRSEARANVLDALGELVRSYLDDDGAITDPESTEPVEITVG